MWIGTETPWSKSTPGKQPCRVLKMHLATAGLKQLQPNPCQTAWVSLHSHLSRGTGNDLERPCRTPLAKKVTPLSTLPRSAVTTSTTADGSGAPPPPPLSKLILRLIRSMFRFPSHPFFFWLEWPRRLRTCLDPPN
jgi:hypothetical protein